MNFFKSKFLKNGLAAFQITRPGTSRNTLYFTGIGIRLAWNDLVGHFSVEFCFYKVSCKFLSEESLSVCQCWRLSVEVYHALGKQWWFHMPASATQHLWRSFTAVKCFLSSYRDQHCLLQVSLTGIRHLQASLSICRKVRVIHRLNWSSLAAHKLEERLSFLYISSNWQPMWHNLAVWCLC